MIVFVGVTVVIMVPLYHKSRKRTNHQRGYQRVRCTGQTMMLSCEHLWPVQRTRFVPYRITDTSIGSARRAATSTAWLVTLSASSTSAMVS